MGKILTRGLCLAAAGLVLFSWAYAQAAPKMEIPNPERDLGTVISGSLINQEFEVINDGDAALTISKLDND